MEKNLNEMILHYEELNSFDLIVDVTTDDVIDYVCHDYLRASLKMIMSSKTKELALVGLAMKESFDRFDKLFDISTCLGWYEIVQDSEKFYEFIKDKHRAEAVDKTKFLKDDKE